MINICTMYVKLKKSFCMMKPLLITISKNDFILFKYTFTVAINVWKPGWKAHLKADANGKSFCCCLKRTE